MVNCYAAADERGFWLLGLEGDRHWPGLVAALERPDLAADERFTSARDRAVNAADLIAELDVAFATRPMAEWAARFDEHDVWWAPINTARSALEDPQVAASGAFVEMPGDDGEPSARSPARSTSTAPRSGPARAPPSAPTPPRSSPSSATPPPTSRRASDPAPALLRRRLRWPDSSTVQ